MCLRNLSFKKHIIFTYHTLLLLLSSAFLKPRRFLQSSSFWNARCALIGQLSSAVWLAEYLKRVMEMLCSYHIWNHTVSPRHGGGGNNTTARIKVTPSFFAYTFGRCYANLLTQWRRFVGCVWMRCFRKVWWSLKLLERYYLWVWDFNLCDFTDLIQYMHEQLVTLQKEMKTWNHVIWPL